ncbi:DUF5343 domain-containing protein [Amycolatopsis sp. cmx-4-83]|uniref:DUF5343 domain-containing protein n=1 Tax=Amycolatopsis sp. cmx-4-83 TaxID=2790940 RepID=UPI00397CA571
MLTNRYLTSIKNVDSILEKIKVGAAPDKFNIEHLAGIGFRGSNDRGIIPLLKELKFLAPDGTPLPRYHEFRDRSRSKAVMAEALRESYGDVFHIREQPTNADRPAIEGLFKSKQNSSDRVAQLQAMTFLALLQHADLNATPQVPVRPPDAPKADDDEPTGNDGQGEQKQENKQPLATQLHYNIQVHLPATKDIEVFNAIFRSLRENLLT